MKRLILFVLALMLFSSCSANGGKAIDLEAFAADMLESGSFDDRLDKVSDETGLNIYRLDKKLCKKAIIYMSSGATAEELALFEAVDSQSADRIAEAVRERLAYQTESFKNYVPAEVPKIEDAVVYSRGNYVILYVAADYNAAKQVLDGY